MAVDVSDPFDLAIPFDVSPDLDGGDTSNESRSIGSGRRAGLSGDLSSGPGLSSDDN